MPEALEIADELLKNIDEAPPERPVEEAVTAEKAASDALEKALIRVKFSIQYKFLIFILLLVICIIAGLSYIQLQSSRRELLRAADEKAVLVLENINTVAFNALFNPDGVDDLMISDIVNKYVLDKEQNIPEVIVYFPDGKVIGHQNIDKHKNRQLKDHISEKYINNGLLLKKKAIRIIDSKNQRNYYLRPVTSDIIPKPIGSIRLAINTSYVYEAIKQSSWLIIILSLIILAVAIILTLLMTRLITTPIKTITQDVKKVGDGNLDHQISLDTSDEIGYLANEFNKMTKNLNEAQKNLVQAASTQKEIEVAGQIQQNLLPKGLLKFDKIEAFGMSIPAKTVGGDYFDFFQISDNLFISVISDVSGKGVPAGLIMTMIKTIIKTQTYDGRENQVADVVNTANRYLANNSDHGKFATINFTLIDTDSGNIINADGGHGDYYVYDSEKKDVYRWTLAEGNMPIGVTDMVEYDEIKGNLKPGDFLCAFTDGITEARNIKEEEYGEERIKKVLLENFHLNAQGITEALMGDCNKFIGEAPQHDDMTIITTKMV